MTVRRAAPPRTRMRSGSGAPPAVPRRTIDTLRKSKRVGLDASEVGRLFDAVEASEGVRYDVSLVVVGDREMRRINREALGHDYPTDVVTFDLGAPGDEVVAGEIVVSDEYAAREAREAGHAAEIELLFYVCHGLLHLAGHDDDTPTKRKRMLARQTKILAGLGRTVRG